MAGLLAALLVYAAVGSAQNTVPPDTTLVTVNGSPVRASEVRLVMQNIGAQMQRTGQQIDEERLFQAATQQVVDTKLLAQEAQRRGLKADQESIDSIMTQIENEAGGREALQGFLGGMSLPYDQFRDSVRESMLAQLLIDQAVRPTVSVTDQEVEEFYTQNPRFFERPEQVHARHILITVDEGATEAVKADAKARAEQARQRATAGEDFATLAKEVSEGPSAPNGGDLGFFSADRMVKPFADAAFALESGQISQVVETRFGYHVIKVEERRAAGTQPLDEVRDSLRNGLVERKMAESVGALAEELRAGAEIVPVAAGQPASPEQAVE